MNDQFDFLTVSYEGQPAYDIKLTRGFEEITDMLDKLIDNKDTRRICIITESNVEKHYLETLKCILKTKYANVFSFTFKAGEENKTLDVIEDMYEFLIVNSFDRKDIILALGGGVTGDMSGYCAATYLRGIRFVQIPTTLLSMVDSSIGGKTGVDFRKYKNMVGAFHQPKAVYMNLFTLNSLDERIYLSGMGEIIKHGLIKDKQLFEWLYANTEKVIARDYETVKYMIYRSLCVKKEVVEKDPLEKGERALLNFGHTLGHSIEKNRNFELYHGECVSAGAVAAAYISMKRGLITEAELQATEQLFKSYRLPVRCAFTSTEDVIAGCMHDKKKDGAVLKFVLLRSIGDAFIATDVTEKEMADALEYIRL